MSFDSGATGGSARRRLSYAVVTSLLLHLLLLWPVSAPLPMKDTPSALRASLIRPPPPSLRAPSKPARAVSPAPTFARPVAEPKAEPKQLALEPPKPVSVPPASEIQPAAVAQPAPRAALNTAPSVTPIAAPIATGTAASDTLLTETNASGVALDGLRGYRLALAIEARRFKRYPAQATASGWTGRVEVRLEVGSDGRARAATLVGPSGHELLDSAALAMIDAGAMRARLPESLRGKAFAVMLPVVFELDE